MNFFPITPKNILRVILLVIFPWLPPYLFEKTDFYFHLTHQVDWYYNLSGNRLLVDMASFAVWGIVVAYLLRPRWAIVQIALNALLVWVLFYVACPVYGPGESGSQNATMRDQMVLWGSDSQGSCSVMEPCRSL